METVRVEDIQELIYIMNSFESHYIYRGQVDKKWKLESSIERLIGPKKEISKAKKYEEFSLMKFKSAFHLYCGSNIKPTSKLQWLSIMQHYGVPTRLLDFTYSPYIALYFCLEGLESNSSNDIALYAIDYRNLLKESIKYAKSKDINFKYTYSDTFDKDDSIFEEYLSDNKFDILWTAEPYEGNNRIDRQSGCFLLSCNLEKKIEELLKSQIYKNVQMKKIIIAIELYDQIYSLLNKVNINSKVLYGDLSGLAKSLKMELFAYNK